MRILVADDNRDAAESLAVLLTLIDHEVLVVDDGSAAVEAAKHWEPDIAVLDLDMPVMNGFAAALALRAQHPRLALIALSGYLDLANQLRAKAVGFNVCVLKGTSFAVLRTYIDTLTPSPT